MSSERNELSEPPPPAKSSRSPFRSITFRLSAWYAGTLLVGLAILGALALYEIRRAVFHSDDVVVHERLERHSEVLGRVGLPRFEEAVESATQLEGDHNPVRVEDGAGHTLYQHGVVEDSAVRVSTWSPATCVSRSPPP